ncbi:MAG: hypothetical protein PVH61_04330 [Candidatus Aminicenantes bacterium]|jgi:hypothetical protein
MPIIRPVSDLRNNFNEISGHNEALKGKDKVSFIISWCDELAKAKNNENISSEITPHRHLPRNIRHSSKKAGIFPNTIL